MHSSRVVTRRPFRACGAAIALSAASLLAITVTATGCGGKKDADSAATPKTIDVDGDPLVILSGAEAVAVGRADAKTIFATPKLGATVAKFVDAAIPIGAEAGFVASRDLESLAFAGYGVTSADAVVVLRGTFDPAKFTEAAEKRAAAGQLVKSTYSDRTLYTSRNVGVTVLSAKTALAGTEGAIRRTLDRLKTGEAKREFAPWMLATLDTPGAEVAVAADFTTHPLPEVAVGPFRVTWLKKTKAIRALGDAKANGLEVAATATFLDAEGAESGKAGLTQGLALASIPAALAHVPMPKDVTVDVKDVDVQIKGAVEDGTIQALLGLLHFAPLR